MAIADLKNIYLSCFKGILIDLDDTIYSYQKAHIIALEHCFQNFEKIHSVQREQFFKDYRWHRDEIVRRLSPQGSCRSRLLAFQELFEEYKLPRAYVLALDFENIYWNQLIESAEPQPEVLEFLKRCKSHGLPVCVVTDMTSYQQILKIKKMGLENLIDYLVTSEEIGAEKPDPRIFQMALRKLKLSNHDVLMIGDHLEKDIQAAKNLEIQTCHI